VNGWGNTGRARVLPNAHVTLDMIKASNEPNQIGRNYGDYDLSRRDCAAKEFKGERG
jgi:hypothetical protein